MTPELITVLMPVYNGGKYLHTAITSILQQTWQNFELIVIDDASTDNSLAVMNSFQDSRIRCITNAKNLGLIRTLNKGVQLAQGKYLARMDQDDIAQPTRLQMQVDYLIQHSSCGIVASYVQYMNAAGNTMQHNWTADLQHVTAAEIRRCLPRWNCLAHPSVMGQTALFKHYLYCEDQTGAEDYDLWLRLSAAGIRIEKIPQYLLRYRVHTESMTGSLSPQVANRKDIQAKVIFLKQQYRQWRCNRFILTVNMFFMLDILAYVKTKLMSALHG